MTLNWLFPQKSQCVHGSSADSVGAWQPLVDVFRRDNGWLVKIELAGVSQQDVRIEVRPEGISVIGTRRDLRPFECNETHLMEIAYSSFDRLVRLPDLQNEASVHCEFRDGMLYILVH